MRVARTGTHTHTRKYTRCAYSFDATRDAPEFMSANGGSLCAEEARASSGAAARLHYIAPNTRRHFRVRMVCSAVQPAQRQPRR